MTIWYVHRRTGGSIASAHGEIQPGYAEEALDDANNAEVQAFFTAANTPPIPEFARSGDFFHALIDLGWYDSIDAVISGMVAANHPQAKLAKVLWDKASRYERNNPLLIAVATAAGKTSDDLDALFRKTLEYE